MIDHAIFESAFGERAAVEGALCQKVVQFEAAVYEVAPHKLAGPERRAAKPAVLKRGVGENGTIEQPPIEIEARKGAADIGAIEGPALDREGIEGAIAEICLAPGFGWPGGFIELLLIDAHGGCPVLVQRLAQSMAQSLEILIKLCRTTATYPAHSGRRRVARLNLLLGCRWDRSLDTETTIPLSQCPVRIRSVLTNSYRS